MTREEAWNRIDAIIARHEIDDDYVTITSLLDYDALRLARKLLEQEPCEDCISRQAVWDVMQELWGTSGELMDRLMALPSVHPKSIECKDVISRKLLKASLVFDNKTSDMQVAEMRKIFEIIDAMPSVTPAEKVGRWIDIGSGQECSECGEIQYGYDSFRKYCANCGVKMQEVDE